MGISFKICRIKDCDSFKNIPDLAQQLVENEATSVDLYKTYSDLLMVLTNQIDDDASGSMEAKLLYGNFIGNIEIDSQNFVGFLSNSEAIEILQWLKDNNWDTKEGFVQHFEHLTEEVKETLDDYGAERDDLYEYYFKNLVAFYQLVVKEGNAVVFFTQ
jgi:Domain of unknown function (DUF1877)